MRRQDFIITGTDMKKKYSVLIKGINLQINIDGEKGKHGFFTTRYIKTENMSAAKRIAMNLIKEELSSIILNDYGDSPDFLFEDILEVEDFGDHEVPGAGFTWFEER
jgi:hypothetical protein